MWPSRCSLARNSSDSSNRASIRCQSLWDRWSQTSTSQDRRSATPFFTRQPPTRQRSKDNDLLGRFLYNYYNWRQDTSSDLQLVLIAFMALILGNAMLRSLVVDAGPPSSPIDFWQDMYEVIVLSFGQEFPEAGAGIAHQVFSVGVAGLGLAGFALVLALVEQVVMEMIDQNVRQGSRVYEAGHMLVLGWCNSQRDLEVVWKSLQQLCYAYRSEGGITVVVLTQREKLEMEALFRAKLYGKGQYQRHLVRMS